MEIALSKKDMEIEHLIAKVQSTIMEYEERLDLKEHKLADISAKLAEGTFMCTIIIHLISQKIESKSRPCLKWRSIRTLSTRSRRNIKRKKPSYFKRLQTASPS